MAPTDRRAWYTWQSQFKPVTHHKCLIYTSSMIQPSRFRYYIYSQYPVPWAIFFWYIMILWWDGPGRVWVPFLASVMTLTGSELLYNSSSSVYMPALISSMWEHFCIYLAQSLNDFLVPYLVLCFAHHQQQIYTWSRQRNSYLHSPHHEAVLPRRYILSVEKSEYLIYTKYGWWWEHAEQRGSNSMIRLFTSIITPLHLYDELLLILSSGHITALNLFASTDKTICTHILTNSTILP